MKKKAAWQAIARCITDKAYAAARERLASELPEACNRAERLHLEADIIVLEDEQLAVQCYYQAAQWYREEGKMHAARGLYQLIHSLQEDHVPTWASLLRILACEESAFYEQLELLSAACAQGAVATRAAIVICRTVAVCLPHEGEGVTRAMFLAVLEEKMPVCARSLDMDDSIERGARGRAQR